MSDKPWISDPEAFTWVLLSSTYSSDPSFSWLLSSAPGDPDIWLSGPGITVRLTTILIYIHSESEIQQPISAMATAKKLTTEEREDVRLFMKSLNLLAAQICQIVSEKWEECVETLSLKF